MDFSAAVVHLSKAIWFLAYVFEGRNYACSGPTFNNFVAEAAFTCLFVLLRFITSFTDVVGGTLAQSTENFGTITASDSELGHVLSCFF